MVRFHIEDYRNNLSNIFHSVGLVLHKKLSIDFLSVARRFEGISFLMYNMIPPPSESWSSLYGGLKSWNEKFLIWKLSEIWNLNSRDHYKIYIISNLPRQNFEFLPIRVNVNMLLKLLLRKDLSTFLQSVPLWPTFALSELHSSTINPALFLLRFQFKTTVTNWYVTRLVPQGIVSSINVDKRYYSD